MARYLAVDHGGSKTSILVFDERGNVTFYGDDRNLFNPGERRILRWHQRVKRLCEAVFKAKGWRKIDGGLISLNGINTERDRENAVRDVKESLRFARVDIVGDSVAALRGAELNVSKDSIRVVICAGSGLNVSLKSDRRSCKSLGWRISPQDQGGYGIGRGIWNASLDAHNGLGKPTALKRLLQSHYRCRSFSRLLEMVSCGQIPFAPEELSPILFKAAHQGDEVAVELVEGLAKRWVGYADLIVRECCGSKVSNVRFYLSGGIFKDKYGIMRTAVRKYAGCLPYQPVVKLACFEPVVGCALLFLERLFDKDIPCDVLTNFRWSLCGYPAHGVFDSLET